MLMIVLFIDISSLLSQLGYDQSSMLPSLNLAGWLMLTPSFPYGSHHLQGENLMSVMTTFECAFAQDMSAFVRTSVIPTTKIMPAGRTSWSIGQTLSPLPPLFGRGVFLSLASGGKVVVTILDSANSALAMLATTLLNSSDSVGLHYTMHGRDMHHFVKTSLDQALRRSARARSASRRRRAGSECFRASPPRTIGHQVRRSSHTRESHGGHPAIRCDCRTGARANTTPRQTAGYGRRMDYRA